MSVYCIVNSRQKLHDPTRKIFLNEPLMFNNNLAHCFRLTLLADNGTDPADMTGVSVSANFIRPDRSTVAIDGTISGNVVEVVLPNACYSSVGRYKLTVDIGEGTGSSAATRTAMIVEGITERNVTDTYVDPGTIMPSINTLISEINDAVESIPPDYDTLLDSIAQTFSESVNYKAGDFVWHGDLADGGKLYRFTEDHAAGAWTGTDVAEAVVTDGVEGNVRYDEFQELTVAQQMHGRGNIQAQHRIEPDGSVALELNDSESAYITGNVGQQIQYNTATASLVFKHVAFVQGGCDYVLTMTSGQLSSYNARTQAIVDDSDVIIQRFNVTMVENGTTETRFTAEADGILCVCVDTSTEDNIQLHGGPVYGTVRYDTAQSLTPAQQAQARTNAGAADVAEFDAVAYPLDVEMLTSADEAVRVLSGGINTSGGDLNSGTRARTQYFRVQPGHRYMFSLNNAEFVVMSAWEYNGTSQSTVIGRVSPSGYTTSRFAFTASGKFARIAFAHADTSVTMTEEDRAQILAALSLKETASDNLAPVDNPTATDTHAAGSLLTVSGQLYKATQAIAPGDAIAAGTNVTETTVAAQLAALEARIAALEG